MNAPSAANPMSHKVSHRTNGHEPCIIRQPPQEPRYHRLWKRLFKSFTCGFPGDVAWIGHFWKRLRLYGVPKEIETESKTIEHGKPAHEEQVNAMLQLIRQFLIAPPCQPHFARVCEQALEFVVALHAGTIAVAHRLP